LLCHYAPFEITPQPAECEGDRMIERALLALIVAQLRQRDYLSEMEVRQLERSKKELQEFIAYRAHMTEDS
jgi:hypothetical protein